MIRIALAILLGLPLLLPPLAAADEAAQTLLQRIADRDRGDDLVWEVEIDLIDRNGNTRQRSGKIYRRVLAGDFSEQVTVFLSPNNIRHTALLDIESAAGDTLWLHVPALKATKRVPPSDRGDKFVGTDFTNEDIDLGFAAEDYVASIEGQGEDQGHATVSLRIKPRSEQLARELGYDDSIAIVRVEQAVIVDQRFFQRGREIRRNQALDIRRISGVLTPMELRSEDRVNNHRTVLRVTSARYNAGVPANLFRKESLARARYR